LDQLTLLSKAAPESKVLIVAAAGKVWKARRLLCGRNVVT
jgi:hypothetical protein